LTIRAKLKGNKAVVRYNNPAEESFLIHILREARDNQTYPHPEISIKGNDGREIPPRKPVKSAEQVIADNKAKLVVKPKPIVKETPKEIKK